MGAAGFILAINIFVAGLFAAAFAFIAFFDRVQIAARWLAVSFLLGVANFVAESLVPILPSPRLTVFSAFALFLAALVTFTTGLCRHYGMRPPSAAMGVLVALALPLNLAIFDMERGSFLRVLLYQLPYVAMQAVAAWVVLRAPLRRALDWVLFTLLAASSLHFASKALLAFILGAGATPQGYVHSTYALVSQSMGSVLIVGAGLLMLGILMRSLLAEATERSETDALSGLLNRRGFESRAAEAAETLRRTGLPSAIVLCDLDHFKAINDNHGHSAGDRVIAAFAEILRQSLSARHTAARIGGEEFAVILPGSDTASARLLAEGVRVAFAGLSLPGLPLKERPTASFGVAPLRPGDTISDMLRRADRALYDAKSAGRDRVRVWTDPADEGSHRVAGR